MYKKIYINIHKDNTAIFRFPDYNIETVAYIGKNGATYSKVEGDGKTPIGEFKLGKLLGIYPNNDKENKLKLDYMQISDDMYWVDDPNSKYYNELVKLNEVNKDWTSAEHLIEYKVQYEYLIEIKSNPNNIPNKGSAIFLHCKKKDFTEGCVAIDASIMKEVIKLIDTDTKIKIDYSE